jgi:hypothetical protein
VFERDGWRCRFCRLAQIGQAAVFHVNHIIPKSKGGTTEEANLALQCPHCSLRKADKTIASDPEGGSPVSLYHPLRQRWDEHFGLQADGVLHGKTPTARATIEALRMNDSLPRVARFVQVRLGLLFPSIPAPPIS